MNFVDLGIFIWYLGSCYFVRIDILFFNFFVIYKFIGEIVWIDFINKFLDGESELMIKDFFLELRNFFELMGIKGIFVCYKLSDIGNLS